MACNCPYWGLPCAILDYTAELTQFTRKRDQSQMLYATPFNNNIEYKHDDLP